MTMKIPGHRLGALVGLLTLALGAYAAFSFRAAAPAGEDERHMLYEAAWATQDSELRDRVMAELGLVRGGETWFEAQTGPEAMRFAREHARWSAAHVEACREVSTPKAARAYIRAHSHCCP